MEVAHVHLDELRADFCDDLVEKNHQGSCEDDVFDIDEQVDSYQCVVQHK